MTRDWWLTLLALFPLFLAAGFVLLILARRAEQQARAAEVSAPQARSPVGVP